MTEQWIEDKLRQAEARISELEAKLNSNEQLFKIIDASPVPYALNDEDLRVTYLNPSFTCTFGYDQSDIPTLDDWWPKAYPDEDYRQWVFNTWNKHLNEAKESGRPFVPIELDIHCKNGDLRTVLASAASLTGSYEGNHLVILYDISERKKLEKSQLEQNKQLAEIINHIPSTIFIKEACELRYVLFNKSGEDLIGIKSEQIIGKNDYDLWPKDQADFFINIDRKVLESGEMLDIPDEPVDTKNGRRSMHTKKIAIHDENGIPKFLLGISEDISELKANKKETERMQKELQQVHKMESLGHLAGGIAHDFNNILGIISGYTELAYDLTTAEGYEKIRRYIEQIKVASKRATNLVSQMLAFSRKDLSELCPEHIDQLIKEDIEMLRATLPSTIAIESHIEAPLPPVLINATQLNQILINLIVNARDAMDSKGQISIKLGWAKDLNTESSVSHKPIIGDWIALSVKDSGPGIPPDIIDDIFTPFYTTKGIGKGTGLGLSVIYGIMQTHNGHILLESTPETGTTFTLLFPPCPDLHIKAEEAPSETLYASDTNHKILVVDDEISLTSILEDFLTMNHYQVESYTDSRKALEAFSQRGEEFSVLITDQTMPGLTGLELATRFREINHDIPIIICSGYGDQAYLDTLTAANMHFFKKPVVMSELLKSISEMLNKHK